MLSKWQISYKKKNWVCVCVCVEPSWWMQTSPHLISYQWLVRSATSCYQCFINLPLPSICPSASLGHIQTKLSGPCQYNEAQRTLCGMCSTVLLLPYFNVCSVWIYVCMCQPVCLNSVTNCYWIYCQAPAEMIHKIILAFWNVEEHTGKWRYDFRIPSI